MTDNNSVRINKYLADAGVCSRRKADELIDSGQVMLNGKVAVLGDRVDPQHDSIVVGSKDISLVKPELEYWVVNKPLGVVSTADDEKGRPKVTDLVPSKARLYPVGRLDENSDGLLLLTNDGEITHQLTHPSNKHLKTYRVIAKQVRNLSLSKIRETMERGIIIGDTKMRVHKVVSLNKSPGNGYLEMELELITGYNRQIRRMCDKIGLEVRKLTRIGFANLKLYDLNIAPGEAKQILRDEIL